MTLPFKAGSIFFLGPQPSWKFRLLAPGKKLHGALRPGGAAAFGVAPPGNPPTVADAVLGGFGVHAMVADAVLGVIWVRAGLLTLCWAGLGVRAELLTLCWAGLVLV
jgi:hypothetical protein